MRLSSDTQVISLTGTRQFRSNERSSLGYRVRTSGQQASEMTTGSPRVIQPTHVGHRGCPQV
ncbi:hypothetical protein ElyMa_003091400, partial [Elysia marginata]